MKEAVVTWGGGRGPPLSVVAALDNEICDTQNCAPSVPPLLPSPMDTIVMIKCLIWECLQQKVHVHVYTLYMCMYY